MASDWKDVLQDPELKGVDFLYIFNSRRWMNCASEHIAPIDDYILYVLVKDHKMTVFGPDPRRILFFFGRKASFADLWELKDTAKTQLLHLCDMAFAFSESYCRCLKSRYTSTSLLETWKKEFDKFTDSSVGKMHSTAMGWIDPIEVPV